MKGIEVADVIVEKDALRKTYEAACEYMEHAEAVAYTADAHQVGPESVESALQKEVI